MPKERESFHRLVLWIVCAAFLFHGGARPAFAQAATNETSFESTLLGFSGKVEFAPAGAADWKPATTGQLLRPGDRLRTPADSRATLRLSDRSVIRVNQLTILEIELPRAASARKRFKLQRGSIFFLNREKPTDIEFETPLATGAIRGTEFLLTASEADGATLLSLFEGAVEMKSATETVSLASGQQAVIKPGQQAAVSAALPMTSVIQWCFYYPGVLNPDDIPFTADEKTALTASISAYRGGDLLQALAQVPENFAPNSEATRVYVAALKLAVGQVEAAGGLLAASPADSPLADALHGVIAAVKSQSWSPARAPATSSEWLANSYYEQSRSRLNDALLSAKKAIDLAPTFGFAWARLAELQFGFQYRDAAKQSLSEAQRLSSRNAQALALSGFIDLDENHPRSAMSWFDRAIALDASLGSAWLGRALAHEQLNHSEEGRRDLETAAALEPQRALFRSYLGKAWGEAGNDALAEKDFGLAKKLDPADPTAWLYSALHKHQTHQLNEAVRDLERSVQLNDHRIIFRSRLLLDRDRAIRDADLAALYDSVGLTDASERAAARAVHDDYANFSGHLFLARSLESREDPARFDLRLETPRQSELLVANLLAPAGAGNLSQLLSQQDHLHYFDTRPIGVSSFTEYRSRGDWLQAGSVFGQVDGLTYAVDSEYISLHGQRPNNQLERLGYSVQLKQQLTSKDSVYFQAGYLHTESGDVAQHYNPVSAVRGFEATEVQEAYLYAGYHREWAPGVHTLLLASRLPDRLTVTNPHPGPLFIHLSGGKPFTVERDPFFSESFHSHFVLYSAELQQTFETTQHALVIGGRYQSGSVENDALLTRGISGVVTDQAVKEDLNRASAYAYYHWRPIERVRFTAGVSYDDLTFPKNADSPPLTRGEESRSRVSPKVGLTIEPWRGGALRAAWARSLGGLYFDESIRLEPTQVAGFVNSFRSLIPESVEGLVPGTEFETWGVGLDQKFDTGTYLGITAELLTSDGSRTVGAFTNATFIQEPNAPTSLRQTLDFEERSLSAYISQLLGTHWAVGARYRLTEGELTTRLPSLRRNLSNLSGVEQDERSTLNHAQLFLIYNHESGFFAQWYSDWFDQNNHGYTPARPGDNFWQHNFFIGYRFPRRHAEIRLGVLNLTDQDYRLNPLNLHEDLARRRTFVTSLRFNF